jgi:hypothetical protein
LLDYPSQYVRENLHGYHVGRASFVRFLILCTPGSDDIA